MHFNITITLINSALCNISIHLCKVLLHVLHKVRSRCTSWYSLCNSFLEVLHLCHIFHHFILKSFHLFLVTVLIAPKEWVRSTSGCHFRSTSCWRFWSSSWSSRTSAGRSRS